MSDVDDEDGDNNDGDGDGDGDDGEDGGGDDDDGGNYEGNDDDNKGGPYLDGSGYFGTAKERCIKAPGWTFIKRYKTFVLCSSTTCFFPKNSFSSSSMMTMTQVLPPEDPRWWSTLRGKRSPLSSCHHHSALYC